MMWRKMEEKKKQWILKKNDEENEKKRKPRVKKIELRKKNIMQHPQEEIKLQEQVLRNLLFTMDRSQ